MHKSETGFAKFKSTLIPTLRILFRFLTVLMSEDSMEIVRL